jgi:betaine/carnitine transporter, BCCT family
LCLALIVSPLGKVRLGGPEATPDFGYVGWFAMLFAAGMGIGLMFFGVSEPMSHFDVCLWRHDLLGEDGVRTDWAPLGGAEGNPAEAQCDLGMAATIFHWGLHPWAIYAVVALALALFSYNKGLPLTHALGLLSDLRRTGLGLAGACHRHPRGAGDGLRSCHLARHRRAAGSVRAWIPVRPGKHGNAMLIFLIFFITLIAIVIDHPRAGRRGEAAVGTQHGSGGAAVWLFIILVGSDAGRS